MVYATYYLKDTQLGPPSCFRASLPGYIPAMALVVQYALTTERGSWIITQLPQYFAVVSQQHHTATHYIQESQPRETEAVLQKPRWFSDGRDLLACLPTPCKPCQARSTIFTVEHPLKPTPQLYALTFTSHLPQKSRLSFLL